MFDPVAEPLLHRFGLPPRLDCFRANTRIEPLHRFSRERWPDSSRTIWVKRDDQTGAATSGNKIRKLSYVLAKAINQGCDTVITCGRPQSNHCRATALIAARYGMRAELLLAGPIDPSQQLRGNLFLSELAGAQVHAIDALAYQQSPQTLAAHAQKLVSQGLRPFVIPMGASDACGALGYVECAYEIAQSYERQKAPWDCVVCTLGSGGTSAGLALGLSLAGLKLPVYSVNMCDSAAHFVPIIAEIASRCSEEHSLNASLDASQIYVLDGHVPGPSLSADQRQIIHQLARTQGLILDPTYTCHGFLGMLQELETGALSQFHNPLFVHTGGIFGLLARSQELQNP